MNKHSPGRIILIGIAFNPSNAEARRGHSGTKGGRTRVTYFAEEGVFI